MRFWRNIITKTEAERAQKGILGFLRGKGLGKPFGYTAVTIQKLYRRLTRSRRSLPDFLLFGVVKGGTTSFFGNLCNHPDVRAPFVKEINYFNLEWHRDLNWYRSFFPPRSGLPGSSRRITGEGSVLYFYDWAVPERIKQVIPRTKLIALLRNPVDRAFSQYQMESRGSIKRGTQLPDFEIQMRRELEDLDAPVLDVKTYREVDEAYGPLKYIRRGIYLPFIEHWRCFFDSEQMLILISEEYFDDPLRELSKAAAFLEINTSEKELTSQDLVRRNIGGYQSEIPRQLRTELERFYHPHNQALADFLGREIPW